MLNAEKLTWNFHRLAAGRRPTLDEVASRSWDLCPEVDATAPRAIFLDGDLDKITDFSPWTNWEYEEPRLLGGRVTHAASKAHLIQDVHISGAWIYRRAFKQQHGFGPERFLIRGASEFQRLDRAHLVSNSPGSHFFGNFLLDDFPLGLLPEAGDPSIVLETKAYVHEDDYRSLFGLPRPPLIHQARVAELVIYTDFAQNDLKGQRYRELRRRLRVSLSDEKPADAKLVYLKRGATGEPRMIINEPDLEAHLTGLGFNVVEPSVLSADEVSRRMLDAELVVSVEGSHLSHAIYSVADNATFLVLEPPDRFATPYKEFADRMDMPFAFLVGDPADGGFTVDLSNLDRLLDRVA